MGRTCGTNKQIPAACLPASHLLPPSPSTAQVAFNPKDTNTFASASLDRTIKVWSVGQPTPNFTLEGHEKGVNCVDYFNGEQRRAGRRAGHRLLLQMGHLGSFASTDHRHEKHVLVTSIAELFPAGPSLQTCKADDVPGPMTSPGCHK